jgi:hypothetical protein
MNSIHVATLSFLAILSFGCNPNTENDDESVSTHQEAIINGQPARASSFGGVLVEPGCSGVLVRPDLVLTAASCKGASTVVADGVRVRVKVARVPRANEGVALLQLQKSVSMRPAVLDQRRLTTGEAVMCFGFDPAGNFTSGAFDVVDLSFNGVFLRGRTGSTAGFQTTGTAKSDIGGFCTRFDGRGLVVAILDEAESTGGVGTHVDVLVPYLQHLEVALTQSRVAGALSLVAPAQRPTDSPTALAADASIAPAPRLGAPVEQAFYLASTPPPGWAGSAQVVSLVSAQTGHCLSVSAPSNTLTLSPCSLAFGGAETFIISQNMSTSSSEPVTYRIEPYTQPGRCLSVTQAPTLVDCASKPPVTFWLNRF